MYTTLAIKMDYANLSMFDEFFELASPIVNALAREIVSILTYVARINLTRIVPAPLATATT